MRAAVAVLLLALAAAGCGTSTSGSAHPGPTSTVPPAPTLVVTTNPTTTGEATALHIADALRDRVTVTRLASGLPVGADLEHADEVTLGKALSGRQSLG